MTYITTMQYRKPRQITWEDVIADKIIFNDYTNDLSNSTATITRKFDTLPAGVENKINVGGMISWLKRFNLKHVELFNKDRKSLYYSFKIPKATGGFRQIDAPCDELQDALRELVRFLTDDCGVLYHTAAFAYIKDRSIVDCLQKHQKNESNWFLKTDFSGFFPSTTLEFAMKMLGLVFPLSEICKNEEGYNELKQAVSLGFLNGGLPQGTVLSPTLTNIISIPIDYTLFNEFAHRAIVYTRYADDMHISAKERFPQAEAIKIINSTLKSFGAPWFLKKEKTHYGNRKGKNWCLGLMINANNDITVGYRNKKYFKSALCSFILDTKNGKLWDIGDVHHLIGQISYYTMIEPEYFKGIINQQNQKWHVNVKDMFKMYLNGTM